MGLVLFDSDLFFECAFFDYSVTEGMFLKRNTRELYVDRKLLFSLVAFVIFGLIMLASAGVVFGQVRFGDEYYFLKRQILYGVVPGVIACFVLSRVDYRNLKKIAVPFFIFSVLCLAVVFIPGIGISAYGATRWIDMGPISFQPSEMMKLALILYLSAWLSSRGRRNVENLHEGFLPFLGILVVVGFLILKQPDAGTFGLMTLVSFAIFFSAGANISHIFTFGFLSIAGFFVMVRSAAYRWDRFMVFLNPELDPQGKGYQINQALLAIGSGGIFGLGLGQSRQKFNYLPEPVTDSIYAIIAEELGLIGSVAVLMFIVFLAYRGYSIASRAPDAFGKLLAIGITSWIFFQAFINIAAITGIIPLTGMTLPFVSYGGTSFVFLLAATGILLNISRYATIKSR